MPRTIRFEKTIIGLREFLLTVTANPAKTYEFILSDSSAAPAWSSVKDHPALITRSFSAEKNYQREIYFSVTKDYVTPQLNAAVDLRTEPESKYPGFMSPGQQYYVHAYQDGAHLKSSEAISTENYPDALPAAITVESNGLERSPAPESQTPLLVWDSSIRALWGMKMWTKNVDNLALINAAENNGELALHRIEVRSGEILYLPIRSIQIFPSPNACIISPSVFNLMATIPTGDVTLASFLYPPATPYYPSSANRARSVLFHGHSFVNGTAYYDVMGQVETSQDYQRVWSSSNCVIPFGAAPVNPGFALRHITE